MSDAAPPKPSDEERNPTFVYVCSGSGARGGGIHLYRLQTKNLDVSQNITLVPLGLAAEGAHASFLELDVPRRLAFALHETDEGAASAYKIEPDGRLRLVNRSPSEGRRPAHLVLHPGGRHLLVANSDGVAVLPVSEDGTLGRATPLPAGKDGRIQGVAFDIAGRFAFACDSAQDKVLVYRFEPGPGSLAPHETPHVALAAGAGPRRIAFRPDGRFAYVASERASTLTVFAYDAAAGTLVESQVVSTLPEYFDGANAAGEVAVHPAGGYLYVSNRGHDSVVLFRIDAAQGTLTYVEEQGTGGRSPRHFGVEPSAAHLAIGNESSDTVLASRIDAGNGRLKPSGVFASAPSPICVKFLPPPGASA